MEGLWERRIEWAKRTVDALERLGLRVVPATPDDTVQAAAEEIAAFFKWSPDNPERPNAALLAIRLVGAGLLGHPADQAVADRVRNFRGDLFTDEAAELLHYFQGPLLGGDT
jgi:hypothetical protein